MQVLPLTRPNEGLLTSLTIKTAHNALFSPNFKSDILRRNSRHGAAGTMPQPPASSHYQQLPHKVRHNFPQRAKDIILQYKPLYNSVFKKTQNLHVEFLRHILYIIMHFVQTDGLYYIYTVKDEHDSP